MAWVYLFTAGLCEIAATTIFRYTDNLTKVVPTVAFFGLWVISAWLISKSVPAIPLGTAYAIWTGIGAAGTAIIGILYYTEPATALRLVFLTLLIVSLVGLKLITPH